MYTNSILCETCAREWEECDCPRQYRPSDCEVCNEMSEDCECTEADYESFYGKCFKVNTGWEY